MVFTDFHSTQILGLRKHILRKSQKTNNCYAQSFFACRQVPQTQYTLLWPFLDLFKDLGASNTCETQRKKLGTDNKYEQKATNISS